MDMERPTRGEKIIVACGAVLLIASRLPLWAKYEIRDVEEPVLARLDIWSKAFSIIPKFGLFVVLIVLGVVLVRVVVRASLPWPAGRIYLIGGALSAVSLLLTALIGPDEFGFANVPGFQMSRGPMLVVGWMLAAAMAYGGHLHIRETDPHALGSAYPPQGPVVLR
jgi:hypothetical protein